MEILGTLVLIELLGLHQWDRLQFDKLLIVFVVLLNITATSIFSMGVLLLERGDKLASDREVRQFFETRCLFVLPLAPLRLKLHHYLRNVAATGLEPVLINHLEDGEFEDAKSRAIVVC